jgi:hypothetical protein
MVAHIPDLSQFTDEELRVTSLPFCQIHNPPNLSLGMIQKHAYPYGIFIPKEQADLAKLKPNNDFKVTQLSFGEGTEQERIVEGFLTTHTRMVVIRRSNIEVQSKSPMGWRFEGLAYERGQLTEIGAQAFGNRQSYRLRTRYLTILLDENNNALHTIPLRLGMGSGTGAAFSTELNAFRKEFDQLYFSTKKENKGSLSERAHALTIIDIEWGIHKGLAAPYLCPVIRFGVTLEESGKTTVVERRDRQVTIVEQPMETLFIPSKSKTGQLILGYFEEYKDFTGKFQNDLKPKSEEIPNSTFQNPDLEDATDF